MMRSLIIYPVAYFSKLTMADLRLIEVALFAAVIRQA